MKFTKIIMFCFFAGCSSTEIERTHSINYNDHIANNRCDEARKTIPLEKDDTKILHIYQGTIGYFASATVMPITLTLDLLLMCRCKYGCSGEEDKKIIEFLFPTTSWTYEVTKDFRCPDNSYYIQKLLEISICYESKGDENSLNDFLKLLKSMSDSYDSHFSCIKHRDGQVIKTAYKRVLNKHSEIIKPLK